MMKDQASLSDFKFTCVPSQSRRDARACRVPPAWNKHDSGSSDAEGLSSQMDVDEVKRESWASTAADQIQDAIRVQGVAGPSVQVREESIEVEIPPLLPVHIREETVDIEILPPPSLPPQATAVNDEDLALNPEVNAMDWEDELHDDVHLITDI